MDDIRKTDILIRNVALAYINAKQRVIEEGFTHEIDWQEGIVFDEISETDFLREAAWVILSSGMRESVVREKFTGVSKAFFEWESAKRINSDADRCFAEACRHFNHPRKIEAILYVATHVSEKGFKFVRESIREENITYIAQFPYMGPATSFHFAKNIGLPVAKPDRHLNRIAKLLGFQSPQKMCSEIANLISENIAVVDLVFWRYATLYNDYLKQIAYNIISD